MVPLTCPFCSPDRARVLDDTELTVTIRDGFPVSPGHTLVILKRHAASLFDMTVDEWAAVSVALVRAKARVDAEHHPDGYNVGVNVGEAAGQTVQHLHVHLIPRYSGDLPDPRGGVRWVLPAHAAYWSSK
jgi:diadenosine tetraphosphate (Ap4A) HIT family hydrolase